MLLKIMRISTNDAAFLRMKRTFINAHGLKIIGCLLPVLKTLPGGEGRMGLALFIINFFNSLEAAWLGSMQILSHPKGKICIIGPQFFQLISY